MSEAESLDGNGPMTTDTFIQTSPNGVDHLVVVGGNCATCGNARGHDEWLTIEAGPFGKPSEATVLPENALVEVMPLGELRVKLRDWRLPVANFVEWTIDGHREGVLAEVIWVFENGIRRYVWGVRRLTFD